MIWVSPRPTTKLIGPPKKMISMLSKDNPPIQ